MQRSTVLLLSLLTSAATADDWRFEYGGHSKLRLTAQAYPSSSVLRDTIGEEAIDGGLSLRLNLGTGKGRWSLDTDYQLLVLHGDGIELGSNAPPGSELFFTTIPNDDRRLFDLTHVIDEGGKDATLHRLDRLTVGYTGTRTVLRFGRQALSWGNGLFYSPMDLVNPFDPAAIDISMEAGVLSVSGQRDAIEHAEEVSYERLERVNGRFLRRFSLPESADAEGIEAKCVNGILEVVIPKQPEVKARRISVEAA